MTEIGGGWYMERIVKGIPLPSRTKLGKKHKKRRMKLKTLNEANKWYNYWKFQLHWYKLE